MQAIVVRYALHLVTMKANVFGMASESCGADIEQNAETAQNFSVNLTSF